MFKRLFVFVAAFLALHNLQAADQYMVDTAKSQLEWTGRKVTGQHHGSIDLKSGQLQVEKGKVSGGKFVIDMTTISNEDLTNPEDNRKLVGHLKSDDFFSVETYPEAKFEITDVTVHKESDKDANAMVKGQLTIKGITHPIEFPAMITIGDDQISAAATIKVDRAKYNVRYGSGSFFDNLGDKLIYDEFDLMVELVAKTR